MFDQNMKHNFDFDSTIMGNNNVIENEVDINMMGNGQFPGMQMQGMPMMQNGINEGIQERVVNRTFVHEVPQDCFFMIEK